MKAGSDTTFRRVWKPYAAFGQNVVSDPTFLNIVGILLAAGKGERFGGDKLLAKLGSELAELGSDSNFDPVPAPAFLSGRKVESDPNSANSADSVGVAACRHLLAAVPTVVAVVRPDDTALAAALAAVGARVVRCARADDGMGASLACGAQASNEADGWVVALADMPWIRPETIAHVAAAIAGGAVIAAPFHRGARGHPVGFGRTCGAALAALTADEGAKAIVAAHREALVRIDVDDPGILRDVDAQGDLCGPLPGSRR